MPGETVPSQKYIFRQQSLPFWSRVGLAKWCNADAAGEWFDWNVPEDTANQANTAGK